MNKYLIAVVIIVFLVDLGLQLYTNKKRNDLLNTLSTYLAKKDYASFDQLMNEDKTRRLIPAFNLAYLKLNEAMMKEDEEEIKKAFGAFNMRMNNAQKAALYKQGFYFYVGIEDKEKAREYYELLKPLNVKDQKMLDVTYNTYVEKGSAYLDEMLEQASKVSEENKMSFYALISDMYRNAGDEVKAKEYEDQVSAYIEKMKKK